MEAGMHCPGCDIEYESGITRCPACGAELMDTSSPDGAPGAAPRNEEEWVDLVTVLKTADASLLIVAKSLLDAEGVPCAAEGEGVQESLGAGRIAASDLPVGPGRLRVHPEDADRARELLASLQPEPEAGGADA
jgi:hypothetical protein